MTIIGPVWRFLRVERAHHWADHCPPKSSRAPSRCQNFQLSTITPTPLLPPPPTPATPHSKQRPHILRERPLNRIPRKQPAPRIPKFTQILLPKPLLPHRRPLLLQKHLRNPR